MRHIFLLLSSVGTCFRSWVPACLPTCCCPSCSCSFSCSCPSCTFFCCCPQLEPVLGAGCLLAYQPAAAAPQLLSQELTRHLFATQHSLLHPLTPNSASAQISKCNKAGYFACQNIWKDIKGLGKGEKEASSKFCATLMCCI